MWKRHSLDAVVELLGQGDRDEREPTKKGKDEGKGEVVDPIFDPIEEEADEDGREGVRFEVVVPVPDPSRDLRVMRAGWGLHIVQKRKVHERRRVVGKGQRKGVFVVQAGRQAVGLFDYRLLFGFITEIRACSRQRAASGSVGGCGWRWGQERLAPELTNASDGGGRLWVRTQNQRTRKS